MDQIGSGGFATVWRGRDRSLDREVAVKVLHESLAADASFVERFGREARNAASLNHNNIVTIHDWGTDGANLFIVMELVEGSSLAQLVASRGKLSVAETLTIAREILGGLAHAHRRGLIHRDIKPANVLIDGDAVAHLSDFGIAKRTADLGLTATGYLLGTPAYLAPEVVDGKQATAASDIYSLGCLLFECLTGAPPFEGEALSVALKHLHEAPPSLRAQCPDVPPALEDFIQRCLDKDPARRFPSAREALDALGSADGQRPLGVPPTVAAAAPVPRGAETIGTAGTVAREAPGEVAAPPGRMVERPLSEDEREILEHRNTNLWLSVPAILSACASLLFVAATPGLWSDFRAAQLAGSSEAGTDLLASLMLLTLAGWAAIAVWRLGRRAIMRRRLGALALARGTANETAVGELPFVLGRATRIPKTPATVLTLVAERRPPETLGKLYALILAIDDVLLRRPILARWKARLERERTFTVPRPVQQVRELLLEALDSRDARVTSASDTHVLARTGSNWAWRPSLGALRFAMRTHLTLHRRGPDETEVVVRCVDDQLRIVWRGSPIIRRKHERACREIVKLLRAAVT